MIQRRLAGAWYVALVSTMISILLLGACSSSGQVDCKPENCTGDPGPGCAWTCEEDRCVPKCHEVCDQAGDCQGDPGKGCTWTCVDKRCVPDCAGACVPEQDCTSNPGTGCKWTCNEQDVCEAVCPYCQYPPEEHCLGDPGEGCIWGCADSFNCLPICQPCEASLDGQCVKSQCPYDYIPAELEACDGKPCCNEGLTCCVRDPHYCETNERQVCVPFEEDCPDLYPKVSRDNCRDLPDGKCCRAGRGCEHSEDCNFDECCVDTAIGKQCRTCPGPCKDHGGNARCDFSCDTDKRVVVSDETCGGTCCEDAEKSVCCDFNSCRKREDCGHQNDCCIENQCRLCADVSCNTKDDCGPADDICCVAGRCSVCFPCDHADDCQGDPGPGCTWNCTEEGCIPVCTSSCEQAGDCTGDPGEGCAWTCVGQLCVPDCPGSCVPERDCLSNPGMGCAWICNEQDECEAVCNGCDYPTDHYCFGDPGEGCIWDCANFRDCVPNCQPCEASMDGYCEETQCPHDYIPTELETCDGKPCCAEDLICCVRDPHYCETNERQVCVPFEEDCPDLYPKVSRDNCRDLPDGKCCRADRGCERSDDCSHNECCVDTAIGGQCRTCPGPCSQHGGNAACDSSCDTDMYVVVSDETCGGACCEDAQKSICCDFASCQKRTDCFLQNDCCVDNQCKLCANVTCETKDDCGPANDVCCQAGRCSICK